ncbi:MAG: preprotein translocase subunit SecA [Verrucomicrobia bacterium 61-8]|nr:preprotein translocase subunit SecA [Verrucomicrobiota bacterium]OJV25762.1 MAG: preprotein translocase subunit SecA [Verrucomicrobia bacterium 61-8]
MFNWIIKKIVGSKNQRELRRMQPIVRRINEIEQGLAGLSDDELRAKTRAWQEELKGIQDLKAVKARLDEILPEAFALVKHAARRLTERKHQFTVCDQPVTWAMIHFDVQLIGGMVLHNGRISEMATGEGKTLVATAPMYLNALAGRGAHLVTVNDYLSRRDAEWMGQLYGFLGLTTGIIQHDQPPEIRRAQYEADITYGTNAEFGFDYLRDNGMATSRDQQVQRGHFFAIVDEVDSILIDEARTPLIISGPSTVSTHQYDRFKPLVEQLVRKQNLLCNRLASDAKELYDAGKRDEAGRAMFKLKLGQPRSKALARMMEDTDMRRLIDKAELEFYKDTEGKAALVALKEELYFTIEERQHDADLTQLGRDFLNPDDPDAFVLPDLLTEFADIDNDAKLTGPEKVQKKAQRQQYCDNQAERIHNISQLLKAYCLYERDVEYVVEENKVVIVDTYTGRKMPGRRWSDGLHQAVEAKEGVQIDRETQTLATITIQNYFRLYARLSGMTGTAETEANEFHDIYGLDVNVIPTNRPVKRIDENDRIYKTRREKYNAVIDAIKGAYAKGQPVLVGTASVESSELLGRMLKREKIPHTVLNAKYHMQEAEIVSRAGLKGAVTISTNMAGRGTDIKLGEGVNEAGGLYVIGTERHESRRIDRQLRGRCARQGDPGMSRFYVSFEDDLMRNFGAADRMTKIMETFGLKEGEELEHPWLNKSVETAQKRVEQRNYMIRRRTLEFDDVMNQQREVVYGYRQEVMDSEMPRDLIFEVINEIVPKKVAEFLGDTEGEEPDRTGLLNWINTTFPLGLTAEKAALESRSVEENGQWLVGVIKDAYEKKASMEHPEALKGLERYIILNAVDRLWQEHLYAMDGLREAVYLRAFAQKDPLVEYKNEAFLMFSELMDSIKGEVLTNLFRSTTNLQAFEMLLRSLPQNLLQADMPGLTGPAESRPQQAAAPAPAAPAPPQHIELAIKRELPKAGRNDPCPCGSGKKYKNCCGRTA